MISTKKISLQRTLLMAIFISLTSMLSKASTLTEPNNIRISIVKQNTMVGEPLVIKVTYFFPVSQKDPRDGDILKRIYHSAHLNVFSMSANEIIYDYQLDPVPLFPDDDQGISYSATFWVWYDVIKKGLIINNPGNYIMRIVDSGEYYSNDVRITLLPISETLQRSLSGLSGPKDFIFLMHELPEEIGSQERRILRLEKVISNSPDTHLAMLCSARLGLHILEQSYRKVESNQEIRDRSDTKKKLLERAKQYLSMGEKLPDEYPIKPKVLYSLSGIEEVLGNPTRAKFLREQLRLKYPKNKYSLYR